MSFVGDKSCSLIDQRLQINEKMQENYESDNEQIEILLDKIGEMERKYVKLEKVYSEKVKFLSTQLIEKDCEFKKLQGELLEVKHLSHEHKKKVQELNNFCLQTDGRVKNRSPIIKKNPEKLQNLKQKKLDDNSKTNTTNQYTKKNNSPHSNLKKFSPTTRFQRPLFNRSPGQSNKYGLQKNSSSERFPQKSNSPKNMYEYRKSGLGSGSGKISEKQSGKITKKNNQGIAGLREKAPSYK